MCRGVGFLGVGVQGCAFWGVAEVCASGLGLGAGVVSGGVDVSVKEGRQGKEQGRRIGGEGFSKRGRGDADFLQLSGRDVASKFLRSSSFSAMED